MPISQKSGGKFLQQNSASATNFRGQSLTNPQKDQQCSDTMLEIKGKTTRNQKNRSGSKKTETLEELQKNC